MLSAIKIPGVYIQQSAELPLSGTRQNTAVPAFVGYTEKAIGAKGENISNTPFLINTLADYELYFGIAPIQRKAYVKTTSVYTAIGTSSLVTIPVTTNPDEFEVVSVNTDNYLLYDSLRVYFANGGSQCYIVSVGDYSTTINSATPFVSGINKLEKLEEATLLVTPDAAVLNETELSKVQKACLEQCAKLQDRFSIFDIREDVSLSNSITTFRQNIGTQKLNYGAAYGPWLRTTFPLEINYENIYISEAYPPGEFGVKVEFSIIDGIISTVDYKRLVKLIKIVSGSTNETLLGQFDAVLVESPNDVFAQKIALQQLVILMRDAVLDLIYFSNLNIIYEKQISINNLRKLVKSGGDINAIIAELSKFDLGFDDLPGQSALGIITVSGFSNPDYAINTSIKDASIYGTDTDEYFNSGKIVFRDIAINLVNKITGILSDLNQIKTEWTNKLIKNNKVFNLFLKTVADRGITIPASGAVAGVYVKTDRERGVWKAPANVILKEIVTPSIIVTEAELEDFNVPNDGSGKTINAIRPYKGKGIVLWGARTLSGNDNEWRYVNVRRLFITMEERLKKDTEYLTFEANDANTWLKIKAIACNYLVKLWREGAMVGDIPSQAFYVNVGLGETMTTEDILEGKLIVEIGVAIVRPSEFIILKFSHIIQSNN